MGTVTISSYRDLLERIKGGMATELSGTWSLEGDIDSRLANILKKRQPRLVLEWKPTVAAGVAPLPLNLAPLAPQSSSPVSLEPPQALVPAVTEDDWAQMAGPSTPVDGPSEQPSPIQPVAAQTTPPPDVSDVAGSPLTANNLRPTWTKKNIQDFIRNGWPGPRKSNKAGGHTANNKEILSYWFPIQTINDQTYYLARVKKENDFVIIQSRPNLVKAPDLSESQIVDLNKAFATWVQDTREIQYFKTAGESTSKKGLESL